MSEKRYYWIKLKTDFFNLPEIDWLLSQKNGAEYIVLYQMLCLMTANNNGELSSKFGEMIIPYDIEKIVRDTKYFDFDTVKVALELYKKLGLVYESENDMLRISKYEEMIGGETSYAIKQRKYRENKLPPLKNGTKRLNREMLMLPNGSTRYIDEKRYGGNGALAIDLAHGKCEICGSEENIVIHHNNGISNEIEDLYCLCRKCHGKVESGEYTLSTHSYTDMSTQEIDIDIEKEIDKEIDINKEEKIPYKEIIDCLNEFAKTNYKHTSQVTKDKIKARWNDGFRLNDFETVIKNKCREWMGTDMEKYLRPKTLFGNNFESYLNQKISKENLNTENVPDWYKNTGETEPDELLIKQVEEMKRGLHRET